MLYNTHINNVLRKTLVNNDTSVFLVGSADASAAATYNPTLSDVDLLFVSTCESFEEYLECINQLMVSSKLLNEASEQSFDVFFLTKRCAPNFLRYLSTLTATTRLDRQRIISGEWTYDDKLAFSLAERNLQKKMYMAQALRFSGEYQARFPIANTSEARQVIKQLTRFLKVAICALEDAVSLGDVETEVLAVKDLPSLKNMLDDKLGYEVPIDAALVSALENNVDNWVEWMMAQEKLASWLAEQKNLFDLPDQREHRFYDGLVVVRYMLFPMLRNILCEDDDNVRLKFIAIYADEVASIVSRLALHGVLELADFTTHTTPGRVRKSFDILTGHLQKSQPSKELLVASVILLEYSFQAGVQQGIQLNE